MNILWIYYCPLIPEAGGTERMTSLIAKGLSRDGHSCFGMLVINKDETLSYNGEPVNDLYSFLTANKIDIVINQLAMDVWMLRIFLDKGGRRWHEEGGKIISCLHFDSRQTSTLYFFKAKRNKIWKDYLWIARSWLLYRYYDNIQAKRVGVAYKWIYDNSDWYITLSETHNPYFIKSAQLRDYIKLLTINNPLTFDDISTPDILERKKKMVLICARMSEYQKRISLVLKCWRKINSNPCAKDWILKIVGTGPDLDYYKEFVDKYSINNVVFEGRQNPDKYYREASIFLMTSGFEGWGLTLTESLQRGVVPVVMNTSPVFVDIIQNGYNGFLTRGSNLNDFTRHVSRLMSDESLLKRMQLNALKSAEKFSLEKTMEKWRRIIPPIVK